MAKDKSFTWTPGRGLRLQGAGKSVAIIGGTGGIGRAFALALAKSGAQVTVVGQTFRDAAVPGLHFIKADLSRMTTASEVAKALPVEDMDVVLFTTGIMAGPLRKTTSEGIEQDLAISYLNRFVMQGEIAPRLGRNRSGRPRIFNVAFPGSGQKANLTDLNSEQAYARWKAHSNTVAGNEGLVLQGAQDFPGVDFFGLNPGFVKTGIRGNLFGSKTGLAVMEWLTAFMTSSAEDYVGRVAPLLFAPELTGKSGTMFSNKAVAILPSKALTDPGYRVALMEASASLVGRAMKGGA